MLYAKAVKDVYLHKLRTQNKGIPSVEDVARDGVALARQVSNTTYTSEYFSL